MIGMMKMQCRTDEGTFYYWKNYDPKHELLIQLLITKEMKKQPVDYKILIAHP